MRLAVRAVTGELCSAKPNSLIRAQEQANFEVMRFSVCGQSESSSKIDTLCARSLLTQTGTRTMSRGDGG